MSREGFMTLDIPVKPYVKNYIESRYGAPSLVPYKTSIGKIIWLLLEDNDHSRDKEYTQYPENVIVLLPERFYLRKGTSITNTNIILFNHLVEEQIKESMRLFVMCHISDNPKKGAIKRAITTFMEWYGLSGNYYPMDMAVKDVYRFRKENSIGPGGPKFFQKMSYFQ